MPTSYSRLPGPFLGGSVPMRSDIRGFERAPTATPFQTLPVMPGQRFADTLARQAPAEFQRATFSPLMAEMQRRAAQPSTGYDAVTAGLRSRVPYFGANPNEFAQAPAPFGEGTGIRPLGQLDLTGPNADQIRARLNQQLQTYQLLRGTR